MKFHALLALILASLLSTSLGFAQDQQSDVYDPFIDYSEFEEAGDEQEDINFFRNGRLFTAGFYVGQLSMTGNMGDVFDPGMGFGLYFSYFFDMRMALQFSFFTSDHDTDFQSGGNPFSGDTDINYFAVDFKYYIKSQNVNKGLPYFNPYIMGGFGSISREVNIDGQSEFAKDRPLGFGIAGGAEFPLVRNKSYIGLQAQYYLVDFDGESDSDPDQDGDILSLLGFIGMNF